MSVETHLLGRTLRYRSLRVRAPDDVSIAIQDHGRGSGRDILFVHGYSQSSLAWLKQTTGELAGQHRLVTYDLRGHGSSEKPLQPQYFRESTRWAGELRAVIDAAGLRRPIVVAWSYAGRVVLDYIAEFGDELLGGLVMVAATSTARPEVLGPATPNLRALAQAQELGNVIEACGSFLANCAACALSQEELAMMLAYNLAVPPEVRAAMVGRAAEYDEVLARVRVPLLLIHGALDPINLPAMSSHTANCVRHARQILYEGVGHMPFWESSHRFDRDMLEFVRKDCVA